MNEVSHIASAFVFVVTSLPAVEAAERMAEALIGRKLAACVNIYPGVRSVYEWNGRIVRDGEVVAFIKTRAELATQVIAEARPLHPYDLPAFLVLPIIDGNEDYFSWVRSQTEGP